MRSTKLRDFSRHGRDARRSGVLGRIALGPSRAVLLLAVGVLVSCAAGGETAWQNVTGPHSELALAEATNQRWAHVDGDGWSYLRRSSSKDAEIVFDHAAPFSPPDVLRIVFTPDMERDHEPSVHWMALDNATEVHAVWWMKLSPNWTASPAGGGKIAFFHATPDGKGQVYSNVGGDDAPHRIDINTEWAPYGQRFWPPNRKETRISYGRWYRIDWHMRWPSAGSDRGVLRWWVDEELNGEYTDVRFPQGGTGFQQFEFAPTRQLPPANEQYMYIDHTAVSAR